MDALIGYAIGIAAIVILGRVLTFPLKKIGKLILNGIAGAIMLIIVNSIGAGAGITVGVNVFSALIAGFFGVPGVIFLIILNMI